MTYIEILAFADEEGFWIPDTERDMLALLTDFLMLPDKNCLRVYGRYQEEGALEEEEYGFAFYRDAPPDLSLSTHPVAHSPRPGCIFCGGREGCSFFRGQPVCASCRRELAALFPPD